MLQLLLALVLNAAVLLLVRRWLRRMRAVPRVGQWVLPTLLLKALVTGLTVVLLSEDARYFLLWSGRMTAQLWHDPGAWLRMLPTDEFHDGRWHLVFHGYSNTFFLLKLLSVVSLASLSNALLTAGYLSLANCIAAWELVRQLQRRWPEAPAAAGVVALTLWPTVLYWTSGLTKESLLVGSGYLLLALVLRLAYGPLPRRWLWVGALAGAAWLHFKMRYFLAVVLLGGLAGLGVVRAVQSLGLARSQVVQLLLLLGLMGLGGWAASEVSPVFRANKFTSQLVRNYSQLVAESGSRPHLEYPALTPTTASAVRYTPLAIANTLTRPWPWEGGTILYIIAGLENLLFLAVLALALVATVRGRSGALPFLVVAVLLLYCATVAALLGLTTPNLGTLNRYRVTFLPFLLLLLLQNDYAAQLLRRMER